MSKDDGATSPDQLSFLLASLKEAQDSVRSYDTKAQIVGVGYIFAIGIVTQFGSRVPNQPEMNLMAIILAWALFILPIVLFGAVLYPTRKMAPKLGERSADAKRTYYLNLERFADVDTYLAALEASDVKTELAYEMMKTAGLRDIKRRRFLRALFLAGASFIVLFLGQILRAEGYLTL